MPFRTHMIVIRIAILGGLSIAGAVQAGEIDQAVLNELRTSAVPHWEHAARLLDDVECHVTKRTIKQHQGGSASTTDVMEVSYANRASDGLRLVSVVRPSLETAYRRAANSEYHFQVAWDGATEAPAQSVPVQLLGCANIPAGDGNAPIPLLGAIRNSLEAGIRVIHVPIAEVLASRPGFRLESVTSTGTDEARRIRVEFVCEQAAQRGDRDGATYWAEVSPHNSWMIDRCGIRSPTGPVEINECLAFQEYKGIPVPKLVRFEVEWAGPDGGIEIQEYEWGSPQRFSRPVDEFFLPHYGISEAVLETMVPERHVWWYVVNGAVVLLLVGWWLYRARRKGESHETE